MSKSKYTNQEKQKVLLNGAFDNIKRRRKLIYQLKTAGYQSMATLEEFAIKQDRKVNIDVDCAACLADSTKSRKKRYNKKVNEFFELGCVVYFLTLTFKPEVIESTSKETRRRYVARFLKENANVYLANIDYGKKNEREHYHAISDVEPKKWGYGWFLYEPVKYDLENYNKVGNYVAKLTNHALKKTTEMNRVIYSRKKRES